MDLAKRLFKGDLSIWFIFLFFCLISIFEVFSSTSMIAYGAANYWSPIFRHTLLLLLGTCIILFLHNVPYKYFSIIGVSLFVAIFLLAITPFVGVRINGELRWLDILGFRFQPSEVAKICSVCYMAFVLSLRNVLTDKQMFWSILIPVSLAAGLIFINNGSTAVLLCVIMYLMMLIGQISWKRMFRFTAICGSLLVAFLILLFTATDFVVSVLPRAGTWKERIERFASADSREVDKAGKIIWFDDEHYQEDHAKVAIARGGVLGQLPGHGRQRDFLPQAYSDFIYAIIIEEMGFAGGMFVLFLYLALLFRAGMIARRCKPLFPKYLVLGCALLIAVQAFINMAVAVGCFPVTGQPLPLISRGGTSTLINCAYIGIILSVSRYGANIRNEVDTYPEEDDEEVSAEDVTENPESEQDKPVQTEEPVKA